MGIVRKRTVLDDELPREEHRWPGAVSEKTVFEEGRHLVTMAPLLSCAPTVTGLEVSLAGRGHLVVHEIAYGGWRPNWGFPWTVLGPDDTILPTGERIPTVRSAILRNMYPVGELHPATDAYVEIVISGDLRVAISLLYQVAPDPYKRGWGAHIPDALPPRRG